MESVKKGEHVTLTDEHGGTVSLFHYEDLILPASFPQYFDTETKLQELRDIKYRHEDILMCSYPKSGNHWLTNLLTMMSSTGPVFKTMSGGANLIDVALPTSALESIPSPRIMTSHLRFERLPKEHFKKGGKMILLLRNPKDVAVSYFFHMTKQRDVNMTLCWDHYVRCFLEGKLPFGSYFDYLNDWQRVLSERKDLNVLQVYYEDLIQTPLSEVKRIQEFLGLHNNDDRLRQILDRCSLANLKADVDSKRVRTILLDRNKKPFLYRKGEIGDWMNHFTLTQNEAFDKVIKDKLSDSIFRFRYAGNVPNPRL